MLSFELMEKLFAKLYPKEMPGLRYNPSCLAVIGKVVNIKIARIRNFFLCLLLSNN